MSRFAKYLPWFLLLASAALFFMPLGSRALWNSDEGRYAEIAREMLELKDWISPHLNYVLYFEKPPLMYWLTAASLALFGQNEWAARFWCAMFGLLTVGVVTLFGKRWKNENTGLLAGTCLATSGGFFVFTQVLVLDMALTFWMTLALYASSRMLAERLPERVKRYTTLLAVAVAGGVMTKGLEALILPVAALGLTVAYTRLWSQARKIHWPSAFFIVLLLAGPWFVLVSLKNPSFPAFFFIHEHVERFLTKVHHRTAPFYYYLPVLVGGFLPWSVFLPKVFRSAWERGGLPMKRDPVKALLVIWSFLITLFFSLSQSKLAGYVLPVLPALALLVGSAFEETLEEEAMPAWIERGVIGLILILVAGLCVLKLPQAADLFRNPLAAVVRAESDPLSLTLGLGVFILVGVWGMRRSLVCMGGIVLVQVVLLGAVSSLSVAVDPLVSNKGLARVLTLKAKPEERVVVYGIPYENLLQTLPFYFKRRIVIEGDPGELEFGRDHAADAAEWFLTNPGTLDAFREVPEGSWIITGEGAVKYLRIPEAYNPVAREGSLILFQLQ